MRDTEMVDACINNRNWFRCQDGELDDHFVLLCELQSVAAVAVVLAAFCGGYMVVRRLLAAQYMSSLR